MNKFSIILCIIGGIMLCVLMMFTGFLIAVNIYDLGQKPPTYFFDTVPAPMILPQFNPHSDGMDSAAYHANHYGSPVPSAYADTTAVAPPPYYQSYPHPQAIYGQSTDAQSSSGQQPVYAPASAPHAVPSQPALQQPYALHPTHLQSPPLQPVQASLAPPLMPTMAPSAPPPPVAPQMPVQAPVHAVYNSGPTIYPYP